MSLINFTARYDLFATQTDHTDAGLNSDEVPLVGSMVFTPVPESNQAVLSPDFSPRPTGFRLLPISGYLDVDGQLKAAPGGAAGVRLPANDPVLELTHLPYRVDFHVRTLAGERVYVDSGYFLAPSADGVIYLANVLKATLAEALAGADPDPGPNPGNDYLIFTDNGDSTWSAGTTGDWCAVVDGFTDNGDSTWGAELEGPEGCDTFIVYGVTMTDNDDSTFDITIV